MIKRILVVAAHPDDEILGCGATMAKHAQAGDHIWALILGQGIFSRRNLSSVKARQQLKNLRRSAERANALLGVKRVLLKNFPDNSFDGVPRLKIVQAIEGTIVRWSPGIVYTHSLTDLNIDHQITCEAVKTACRPMQGSSVRQILAFEVPSSTEWRFDGAMSFHPNIFISIEDFLDKKWQALKVYGQEMRDFPHPRSEKYIRSLAFVRGGQSGLEAAEAFQLVRDIRP